MFFKKIVMTVALTGMLTSTAAKDYNQMPVPVGPICEMAYSPSATHFCLWSPEAETVRVNLYTEGIGGEPTETIPMISTGFDGNWTAVRKGDLNGLFYTFQVQKDGQWLTETPGIFAKSVGENGQRAQVMSMEATNPDGWEKDQRPALASVADAVVYELHHRDFSIDPESGIRNRGKYLALAEHGASNAHGERTGIDHLQDLGVNHVHILPSYDFGSVDESNLQLQQYNWGYDPVNYNVPEGSYSTNPKEPSVRIREFKQMVMSLHQAGIRVVLDVVYNHVFDLKSSNFERTAPSYFFRWKEDGKPADGSGCGNETASERPMMRKFMVESVLYWMKEYHIDGFRFDLMGVHDMETMKAIREAVNTIDPSVLIYGEGWAAATPALPENQLAMKKNMQKLPGIAAFGDEMRDGLRGGWSNDKEGAFLIGKIGNEESVKFGLVGAIQHPQVNMKKVNYSKEVWTDQPTQMMSYVSCHDDMCLADRIQATAPKANPQERVRLQKLAETVVLTSQGIPFIWCGDEMMRDKKGVHNSYNSPDSINMIPWANKSKYQEVYKYVRDMITLRKEHPAFRLGDAELVRKHLEFLPVKTANLIAFQLKDHAGGDAWKDILVILNSNKKPVIQAIPEGEWTQIVWNGDVRLNSKVRVKGKSVKVEAQSALIMKRE